MNGNQHLLLGPDGLNLLGFMCSVGLLAVLSRRHSSVARLSWQRIGGGWRPVLELDPPMTREDLVNVVHREVTNPTRLQAFQGLDPALKLSRQDYRSVARQLRGAAQRADADLFAALVADVGDEDAVRSCFVLLRGAGHEAFLDTAFKLATKCSKADIERALFGPWTYPGERFTFRWDPVDRKEYALMAGDPVNIPKWVEPGANLLALEGLAVFTVLWQKVGKDDALPVGFDGDRKEVRWALWRYPATFDVVRSLMTHPVLRETFSGTEQAMLRQMGICAVVTSRLERYGKNGAYRSFAHGRVEWQSL